MMPGQRRSLLAILVSVLVLAMAAPVSATQGGPFTTWENGPPNDPNFFPIGVWAQVHTQAATHANMGMNMYWSLGGFGSMEQQLTAIRNAGLYAVAHQNDEMRTLLAQNSPLLNTVVAWMQQDEPDNAKSGGDPWRYIRPDDTLAIYNTIRTYDSSRPVFMNLGQGVAWDQWHGRGIYTGHWWDYPEYQKSADILSFDIYPASSTGATAGQLWRVAYGVKRLREWTDPDKPVWNIIEASRIREGRNEVTPHELRALAWMSIVHGSTGIGYFVHYWDADNRVTTNSLAGNPVLRPAVTALNAEITSLAAIINSPTVHDRVQVLMGNDADTISRDFGIDGIATMLKEQDGELYLFTVRMRESDSLGIFQLEGLDDRWKAHVIGEDRVIAINENGIFQDHYQGWDTRLYHIVPEPTAAALLLAGLAGVVFRRPRHSHTAGGAPVR
jgi:hypothetical protein